MHSRGHAVEVVLLMLTIVVTSGQPEFRTTWYEVTEYRISEFGHTEVLHVVLKLHFRTRSKGYARNGTTNTKNEKSNSTTNTKSNVEIKDRMAPMDMSVGRDDDKK